EEDVIRYDLVTGVQTCALPILWELARFRDLPEVEEVGSWLERNIPVQATTTLIHGDWKLDNVMFAPESPARLVAVTDWEMSTLRSEERRVGKGVRCREGANVQG